MKPIVLLGIIGVIVAVLSCFAPWGVITLEYPEPYSGPVLFETLEIPGSLLVQSVPLTLGIALVLLSMVSSAINPEKQYLVGGVLQLTGGIVMLVPVFFGAHAYYWGYNLVLQYLPLLGYIPGSYTSMPKIAIGWGVPLYIVGSILPIIAGVIWLATHYSIVEKE